MGGIILSEETVHGERLSACRGLTVEQAVRAWQASKIVGPQRAWPYPFPPMAGGQTASVPTSVPTQGNSQAGGKVIPFALATYERSQKQGQISVALASAQSAPQKFTVKGTGFMAALALHVYADASGNASTNSVAFAEDAPWNVFPQVTLEDSNGQILNLDGFSLYEANLIDKHYINRFLDQAASFIQTTGTGGTAGTFEFWIWIPIMLNHRDLSALLGNQDRAQEYTLTLVINSSSNIYGTAPTSLPTVKVDIYYENFALPPASSASGAKQAQLPPSYGLLHFLTTQVSDVAPGPGTQNHYLKRLGNTIRAVGLTFRQGSGSTPRSAANGDLTGVNAAGNNAAVQLVMGDNTQYNEDYDYRRAKMYQRYGFDFPNGILVYEQMHDFQVGVGNELGTQYWRTKNLGTTAQFQITYPSAYAANASNSLTFLTDDLIKNKPTVALAAA
ncbi:MAG: hypothetical protein KGJ45_11470 [Elusimicrobia bacterium]|nr:hypothetical protein [Elusimicrobiota bacterium]